MAICRQVLRHLIYGLFVCSFVILSYFYATDISLVLRAQTMHQRQEARKQLINQTCSSYNVTVLEEMSPGKLSNFIVDDAHGLIYCYIPKVGCSNLKKMMVTLKNGPPYRDPGLTNAQVHVSPKISYLKNFPRHEIKAKLKHYTKFMFVRDPFVRLVSAYRNKFVEHNEPFYSKHGRPILHFYGNHPYPPMSQTLALASGIRVSFDNFVQYLLDPRMANVSPDEHWNQMNNLCHPCHMQYDFIGHQETMDDDIKDLLEILMLKDEIQVYQAFPKMTTSDSMATWFKVLPLNAIRALYQHYEIDYKLFGYREPSELWNGTNISKTT
ncbi:carbohydrate sulfotransferase 12-like [Solea senegalensis]|nr:carbohydrate sulfotransferase 12-like isoform X1 [Solea senegalensis]KAG7509010.1 carbohydrate sulfotransferase 12-like [Solea senegalensis]